LFVEFLHESRLQDFVEQSEVPVIFLAQLLDAWIVDRDLVEEKADRCRVGPQAFFDPRRGMDFRLEKSCRS
jgi:hypothetical protein